MGAQKNRKCAIYFIAVSVFTFAMVAAFIVIGAIIHRPKPTPIPSLPTPSPPTPSSSNPSPLSFQDVQIRCIDHFLAARYDGSGGVYVARAEPLIHTSRGDCNGLPQGWQLIFQFDTRGRSSVSISISGTALGRTCTGHFTTGTTATYQEVFTSCSWGETNAQFPIVTTSVFVT